MDVPRKKNTSLSMYIVRTSVPSCIFIITDLQWTYTHMLPKCLLFVCWTPFVGCNMWSFTVGTFWLFFLFIWASFMMMALPTDKVFDFTVLYICIYYSIRYTPHSHAFPEEERYIRSKYRNIKIFLISILPCSGPVEGSDHSDLDRTKNLVSYGQRLVFSDFWSDQ